jgi:hypothetical protein
MADIVRSWTRLEPVLLDPSLGSGLRAEIADPLWLIARQWQFGELAAQDAGSPAEVQVSATISQLTRYRPAPPDGTPGQRISAGVPLETLIEAERPDPSAADLGWAVRAGRHYLRLLEAIPGLDGYAAALISRYPITPSGAMGPFLAVTAARTPDGTMLAADLRASLAAAPPALPASPPPPASQAATVLAAARQWLAWYDAVTERNLPAADAWTPARLEYQPTLSAPRDDGGETVLTAAQHTGGPLDWWNFDIDTTTGHGLGAVAADLPAGTAGFTARPPHTALVSPVTFPGAPAPRFWQYEDAAANLTTATTSPDDMVTTMLVDYALRYGNEFYLIPLPMYLGDVCTATTVIVTTTFGDSYLIPSIAARDGDQGQFRLFEHTTISPPGTPAPRSDTFVLFPAASNALNGTTVEETHLLRDNIALLAWGIEQTITGPDGTPHDQTSEVLSAAPATPTPPAPTPGNGNGGPPVPPDPTGHPPKGPPPPHPGKTGPVPPGPAAPGALTYLIATTPPPNWLPLLPQTDHNQVTTLARYGTPTGRFLTEITTLPDEEITQAGVQLTRRWRYTRWTDGTHHAWIGRSAQAGRGPGNSGLRFDITQPQPGPGST